VGIRTLIEEIERKFCVSVCCSISTSHVPVLFAESQPSPSPHQPFLNLNGFSPENVVSMFLRNAGRQPKDYTAQQPRSSSSLIVQEWILGKSGESCEPDLSGHDPAAGSREYANGPAAASCEHGNDPSGCLMSGYQRLMKTVSSSYCWTKTNWLSTVSHWWCL
jgi:hypothetical protein